MALQQLLLRPMAFKKAVLLVDSKSAIQTVASNKQVTTQILKEARRATTLLNRQGKTKAFQWVPSHIGIHRNETADLLGRGDPPKQTKITKL
jgi:ribonuclease HI